MITISIPLLLFFGLLVLALGYVLGMWATRCEREHRDNPFDQAYGDDPYMSSLYRNDGGKSKSN